MRTLMTVSALMLSVSVAFAGGRNDYQQTKPVQPVTNNYGGKGGAGGNANAIAGAQANAAAIAGVKNTNNIGISNRISNVTKVQNTNRNSNKNTNKNSNRNTNTNTASSYSGGNSLSNYNKYEAAASSAISSAGNSTAPCQGYLSAGLQVTSFGASFASSRSIGWCKDVWLAETYKGYFGKQVARQYLIASDPKLRKIVNGK